MQANQSLNMSLKALALAAALAATCGQVGAQTVIIAGVGQPRVISDPFGSGRSEQIMLLGGSAVTAFGNGDYYASGSPLSLGGAVGFLNVAQLQVGGVNGLTTSESTVIDDLGDTFRVGIATQTSISSISAVIDGPSAGSFQVLSVNGGTTLSGTRIPGTLTGGDVQVGNIRLGIANGQVIADLSGTLAAIGTKPAVAYNAPNTVLWTFDPVADVMGPTQINPTSLFATDRVTALQADGYTNIQQSLDGWTIAFTANSTINNLKLTSAGATFFTNALGLQSTGQDALKAANGSLGNKWGSINTSMTFITVVPEPSTYTLMGLGLVGLCWVVKRKCVGSLTHAA